MFLVHLFYILVTLTLRPLNTNRVHQSLKNKRNFHSQILLYERLTIRKVCSLIWKAYFSVFVVHNFFCFTKSKNVIRFSSRISCQNLKCPVEGLEDLFVSTSVRVSQQAQFVLMFRDPIF